MADSNTPAKPAKAAEPFIVIGSVKVPIVNVSVQLNDRPLSDNVPVTVTIAATDAQALVEALTQVCGYEPGRTQRDPIFGTTRIDMRRTGGQSITALRDYLLALKRA